MHSLIPAAVSYRPFQPDADVPRLVQLLEAVEASDRSGLDVNEAEIVAQMRYAGHDPRQDRWVAESNDAPGEIVGFGAIYKPPTGERADAQIYVHPAYRRSGIGSTLLTSLLQRARHLGAQTVGINASAQDAAAEGFLKRQGFVPVSAYTRLHVSGTVVPPLALWPTGYSARVYDAAHDFSTLLDGLNRCYAGQWGHNPVTAEELATWLPDFSPDGIFFAFGPGQRLVGMVRAETSERLSASYGAPTLNLDAPGVIPELRHAEGVDLYTPLLVTAWRWARAHFPGIVQLESWGDTPHVLARYQRLGFRTVLQRVSYRHDLNSENAVAS